MKDVASSSGSTHCISVGGGGGGEWKGQREYRRNGVQTERSMEENKEVKPSIPSSLNIDRILAKIA